MFSFLAKKYLLHSSEWGGEMLFGKIPFEYSSYLIWAVVHSWGQRKGRKIWIQCWRSVWRRKNSNFLEIFNFALIIRHWGENIEFSNMWQVNKRLFYVLVLCNAIKVVKRNANVKSKSKMRAGVVLDGSFHLNMLSYQYETYLPLTNCKRIENLLDRKFRDILHLNLFHWQCPLLNLNIDQNWNPI